ncbi:MAG TPA: NAD(P)/FAD-dependent oxidoreductase [Acidimicrobiales bacterium]|nr:NAD(P)/FAD-dependent oxidoreductase [Acidimicrobiales bacterium]
MGASDVVERSFDLVVVGGGIAGSALAARMAQAGRSVLILEAQERYRDKIRGETVAPWGVREVQALELEDVLLAAGGEYTEALVPYDETVTPEQAEAASLPYKMLAPDVPGELNVGHPEASEALAGHAEACGARLVRGASEVKISAGSRPEVQWSDASGHHQVSCRLIIGADGRGSAVRRQLGIGLEERPADTYGTGVLVQGETGFTGRNTLGTAGDVMFLAFPRAGNLTRLYLLVAASRQSEFSGPKRLDAFLAAFPNGSFPASAALAAARVAGPCGGSPMTDSWTTSAPVAEGAVLVGDAAGWNDPIIGQGLSIALRDARSVSDVLRASEDWSPSAFGGYVEERAERMRRLAVSARVHTAMRCHFDDVWRARRVRWRSAFTTDPAVLGQAVCCLTGPEAFPAQVFTDGAVERTLAM